MTFTDKDLNLKVRLLLMALVKMASYASSSAQKVWKFCYFLKIMLPTSKSILLVFPFATAIKCV